MAGFICCLASVRHFLGQSPKMAVKNVGIADILEKGCFVRNGFDRRARLHGPVVDPPRQMPEPVAKCAVFLGQHLAIAFQDIGNGANAVAGKFLAGSRADTPDEIGLFAKRQGIGRREEQGLAAVGKARLMAGRPDRADVVLVPNKIIYEKKGE